MIEKPKEVIKGAWSLILGMAVTIKAFFSPVVTCQYPRETLRISPRFRGHIKLVEDEETGRPKCIACGVCARSCPSESIKEVEGEKREGEKKKSVTKFILDFTTCSQCGICVEICPTGAITFSADYNLAGFSKEDFYFDLVEEFYRWKEKRVESR